MTKQNHGLSGAAKGARIVLAALMAFVSLSMAAAEETVPRFRIGVYRFNRNVRTEERFRDMKEAGVDFFTSHDIHGDKKSLDTMQRLGIETIAGGVLPHMWGGNTNVNGNIERKFPLSRYEKAAKGLERHPAEWMYSAGDELSALDFPYLGKAFRRVQEINPAIRIYLNLHPCTQVNARLYFGVENYRRYIEEYCRYIPLDYISYDLYIYAHRRDWAIARLYENFRIVSDACRDTGRKLRFIAQVNTRRPSIDITEQKLRYQAWSAMAFGAESLAWACWSPGWWTNNVLTATGEKTVQYGRLKTVNMEIRRMEPHYMRFVRKETFFTGFTGPAAKWLAPCEKVGVPQVNFNLPDGIDTEIFKEVKSEDGLPIVAGDMEARDGGSERALFVFAADDPYDENPRTRTVRFSLASGSVKAIGPDGPVKLRIATDGTYSFDVRSSMCVMLVARAE